MLNETNRNMNFEDMLALFQETSNQMQETRIQMQETRIQFQENNKKFQETERMLTEKFKETDRQMKNLMKKMSESESRWGRFIEALVEGTILKILKKRKIKVDSTLQRVKGRYNNRHYEFDIIAKNGIELVAIEVKTTLSPDDIKEFLDELKVFKKIFPEWIDKIVYGAVAYINMDADADKMAEKQGLFVIKATNDSAKITNPMEFQPRAW